MRQDEQLLDLLTNLIVNLQKTTSTLQKLRELLSSSNQPDIFGIISGTTYVTKEELEQAKVELCNTLQGYIARELNSKGPKFTIEHKSDFRNPILDKALEDSAAVNHVGSHVGGFDKQVFIDGN